MFCFLVYSFKHKTIIKLRVDWGDAFAAVAKCELHYYFIVSWCVSINVHKTCARCLRGVLWKGGNSWILIIQETTAHDGA